MWGYRVLRGAVNIHPERVINVNGTTIIGRYQLSQIEQYQQTDLI
jgi:hypothetical protein